MYRHFFKRFLDFWISLIALVLISPLLLVVTIWLHFANKRGSLTPNPSPKGVGNHKGEEGNCLHRFLAPAIFLQERPGKDERIFKVIKFKTMTDERDAEGNLLPDEQRLTKVGRFVRSTSIDELPQLINVLKGDMALIGPRPLLVRYLPWYTEEERHRHDIRPGISGWAQSHGRNTVTWDEKLAMDVWYVNHVSLKTDVNVILKTIKSVLLRESVEVAGVEALDVCRMKEKGIVKT